MEFEVFRRKEVSFCVTYAMVVKIRKESGVRQRSLLIGVGVNEEGYREVLGVMIGRKQNQ